MKLIIKDPVTSNNPLYLDYRRLPDEKESNGYVLHINYKGNQRTNYFRRMKHGFL